MPNYQNGKIYCLRSYKTERIYIGSTTQTPANRLAQHTSKYNKWKLDNTKPYTSSFEILKYGDAYVELLELNPCGSKIELTKREGELIRANDCVNKCIAGRTKVEYHQDNRNTRLVQMKQYYQDNKQVIAKQVKQYRQGNKQKISEWKKTRIKCDYCDCEFTQGNKMRHIRSQQHITNHNQAHIETFGEPFTGELDPQDY